MVNQIQKYLHEVRVELRKVVWPTRQQTAVFTLVVLISVLFVAALIWAFDMVLNFLTKWLFGF